MSAPIELDERRAARARPFQAKSLGELQGKEIKPRNWLIPSVLIRRSITMFSGDGGVGKSLLMMQLQVACALGVDWLGLPINEPISSFGFYCEDDDDELERRFFDICRHYGCQFSDIGDSVRYASRVGEEENELIEFRGRGEFGKPTKTSTFHQVVDEVKNWGSQLVILDTLSDVFAGNENIRYQAKSCTTILRAIALINNGGVILNTHPSKSSMVDGSGFSGSTAWKGGVRNQMFLSKPKRRDDEEDGPTDDRILKCMKSNYGPDGSRLKIRWQDGVFVLQSVGSTMFDKLDARRLLLDAARYLVENGTYLSSEEMSRSGLMVNARKLPSCASLSMQTLRDAQKSLIESGDLINVEVNKDRKWIIRVRPTVGCRYPIERPLQSEGASQ